MTAPEAKLHSCLYEGTVQHRRLHPRPHRFRYGLYLLYLDLDELEQVFAGRWLWSCRRFAPAWFRRDDYLAPTDKPLDHAVRNEVLRLTGRRPDGPIRLLTQLRTWGWLANPVSFYYCFRRDGQLDAVLAEITNTPWGERHCYAVAAGPAGAAPGTTLRRGFAKQFHVSPFQPMELDYDWRLSVPGERLRVRMANRFGGQRFFDASLRLNRRPISGPALARALLRWPGMSVRVSVGIYWQALRLWWKGTPFHVHPRKRVEALP